MNLLFLFLYLYFTDCGIITNYVENKKLFSPNRILFIPISDCQIVRIFNCNMFQYQFRHFRNPRLSGPRNERNEGICYLSV